MQESCMYRNVVDGLHYFGIEDLDTMNLSISVPPSCLASTKFGMTPSTSREILPVRHRKSHDHILRSYERRQMMAFVDNEDRDPVERIMRGRPRRISGRQSRAGVQNKQLR